MRVHITNIYGIIGAARNAQQMVAEIAKRNLHYNELGIYNYPMQSDSRNMLHSRLDGIIASVSFGDIVIFQLPTWNNNVRFDESFVEKLNAYRVKKIFFIHDIPPLMFESYRNLLERYINMYNQADVIILPSQEMALFLQMKGLMVDKVVIQRMWDCPTSISVLEHPKFRKVVNFAGDINAYKFSFAKEWKYNGIKLAVTANEGEGNRVENIEFLGWFDDEVSLINVLRNNGGFGLLWSEDAYWLEYMKMNACCKLGTYLGAGLPVIVCGSIPEAETIRRKNLGFVVESLDEAVEKIESVTEEQYNQMTCNVKAFGNLIRGGYFTKKVLLDSIFKLFYD